MTDRLLDRDAEASLERTRSAVVNVLMVVAIGIAASGWLLRWRDGWAVLGEHEALRRGLLVGLAGLVLASFATRRALGRRDRLRDPALRARRFFWGHVGAAAIGALAMPLGLAFGWFIRPRLDAVAPFWVAALALGFLAIPRASELEGVDEPPGPVEGDP